MTTTEKAQSATTATTADVVVLGPNYWGKGTTEKEAKAKFREHGGVLSRGYVVLTFDPETTFTGVNDMGYYHWRWRDESRTGRPPAPTTKEVAPR